ncbi:hypothetical protein P154DRAFT_471348, partial [Amniculicola lignicola CBS 123094]
MPSSNSATALIKRPALGSLMAPPPAPKRIKRPTEVLPEDTYVAGLEHIIRRDFFPTLEDMDAQEDFITAVQSGDKSWIRETARRLTGGETGRWSGGTATPIMRRGVSATPVRGAGETPRWGSATPSLVQAKRGVVLRYEGEDGTRKKVDLSMSLSVYQESYISEDQESFSKVIDRQNAKRFENNEWMRNGNRYASRQRLAQQKVLEAKKSANSSQEVILRPSEDLDKRQAAPNTHKHTSFNNLMFGPDSLEDQILTRAQLAEQSSLAPPKAISHINTRLPDSEFEAAARPPSPTMSAVRDAIRGQPRLSQSEIDIDGGETPMVGGYKFVDPNPPSPTASDEEDVDENELLDRIIANNQPGSFTISDAEPREKMHHRMVEKIGQKRSSNNTSQTSGSGAGGTGVVLGKGRDLGIFKGETPRFLSAPGATPRASVGMTPGRKTAALTPAGQRLFERVGGGTPRREGAIG